MRGWDDPRMPTISGLRRRGYTADIINSFCKDIGVTRNENLIQYERLSAIARGALHECSVRVMAALSPLKVIIKDAEEQLLDVPDFPHEPSRGSHDLTFEGTVYIDSSDFRMEDDPDYFGLAPGKMVNLKYASTIRCVNVKTDKKNNPVLLECVIVPKEEVAAQKPKGTISWVPKTGAIKAEVRLYDSLFTVEEPSEAWESELNPKSEIIVSALIDPSLNRLPYCAGLAVQFERLGFFTFDSDTKEDAVVFNRTVLLKDSKPKDTKSAGKSRKAEQEKALADKLAKATLNPVDMFMSQTDLYSQFDDDGIPTHDASGEKLSKSGYKKLKKEWEKQKKNFEANQK